MKTKAEKALRFIYPLTMMCVMGFLFLVTSGCSKDSDNSNPTGTGSLPTLTTTTVTGISQITAVSGGAISSDGGAAITARGVCWGTTANPTVSNSKTTDGTGSGSFISALSGLTAGQIYYVRAYATNSAGTSYGDQKTFTALAVGSNPGGSGTSGDPYLIAVLSDLQWLSQTSSVWNKNFKQVANINASATSGTPFSPIGNTTTRFTGTYEGQNFTIDQLHINLPSSTNGVGLFGDINGSSITNVGLTNVAITGKDRVGAVVGNMYSNSTVTNCYASGSVTGNSDVGGVVGYNGESSGNVILNCHSSTTVTGFSNVGGVVGVNGGTASNSVTNCYNTGTVTGISNGAAIGGVVGYNANSVTSCYNTGTISGVSSQIGGLVGWNVSTISNSHSSGVVSISANRNDCGGFVGRNAASGTTGNITNSYSTGNVSGGQGSINLGGFVGNNISGSSISGCYSACTVAGGNSSTGIGGFAGYNAGSTITNSYATGNVLANVYNNHYIGGFVGMNDVTASVTNCYCIGSVAGMNEVGGFAGYNNHTISGCFWDQGTANQTVAIGGGSSLTGATGVTDAAMKTPSTFAGWDAGVWKLVSSSYPQLQWQP